MIGFQDHEHVVMLYEGSMNPARLSHTGLQSSGRQLLGPGLLGRVVDGLGRPLDGRGSLT